jgi:hypothetical protein
MADSQFQSRLPETEPDLELDSQFQLCEGNQKQILIYFLELELDVFHKIKELPNTGLMSNPSN